MANIFTRLINSMLSERAISSNNLPVSLPNTNKFVSALRTRENAGSSGSDHATAVALSAVYLKASKSREGYTKEFENIKGHYLTYAILTLLSEESLTPDVSSGSILTITTDNDQIRDELDRFQKQFNLDQIVDDFVYDLLSYGEYNLKLTIEPGQGVVKISDNVPVGSVVGFYDQGYPFKFMVREGNKINIATPSTYAHFILSNDRINMPTFSGLTQKQIDDLPQEIKDLPANVRIGRPVLFGVIEAMKNLDLLEKIVPATKIADIMAASIVGVEVPAATDPAEAFKIAGQYENLFNKKVTLTDAGQLTAVDILAQAGRTKVVPIYEGKGGMQSVDVRTNQTAMNIMDNIRDFRDVICSSIGIPTELLFGSQMGNSKADTIKRYVRYQKLIKVIQNSIASGVIQICLAHFSNLTNVQGVNVSDFEVTFDNEQVNVDELEKLEYHDATISYIRNTFAFLSDMANVGMDDMISDKKFRKWISEKLEFIDAEADEHKGDDYSSGAGIKDPLIIKNPYQTDQSNQPQQSVDMNNLGGQPDQTFDGRYSQNNQ